MIKRKIFCLLVLCVFVWGCSSLGSPKTDPILKKKAHDFTLPDQNGDMVTLSDLMQGYRGAVIAFYPKDDSRN